MFTADGMRITWCLAAALAHIIIIAVQRFEPVLKKRRFGGSGSNRLTWRTWALKLWYQQKNGELERRSLSKIEQGGTGGLQPPRQGSVGLEAPQEQQGVWGAAAPR